MTTDDIKIRLALIEEKIDRLLDLGTRHQHELEGNGKPGLKQDVHDLKRFRAGMKYVLGVIGATCAGLVGRLVYVVMVGP